MRSDKDLSIDTIYFGGGTPSLLSVEHIKKVLSTINNCFAVLNDCEITLEANPLSFDLNKALVFSEMGINRMSIGIQSLNDLELNILGRIHSKTTAIESIMILKQAGFNNIAVDLIYGIPNQDLNSWADTLMELIKLNPQHISTYELTINEGTVIHTMIKNKEIFTQSDEEIEQIYLYTRDFLTKAGYKHYEISNFCLDGFHSRHNYNYWARGKYIGFGVSSHSFDGLVRSYNSYDIAEYITMLNNDQLPVKDMEYLGKEVSIKEQIFLGLRTNRGIDKSLICGKEETIKELYNRGYLEYVDDRIRLTPKGLILSNEIILKVL